MRPGSSWSISRIFPTKLFCPAATEREVLELLADAVRSGKSRTGGHLRSAAVVLDFAVPVVGINRGVDVVAARQAARRSNLR
jgi:hypothetical protein